MVGDRSGLGGGGRLKTSHKPLQIPNNLNQYCSVCIACNVFYIHNIKPKKKEIKNPPIKTNKVRKTSQHELPDSLHRQPVSLKAIFTRCDEMESYMLLVIRERRRQRGVSAVPNEGSEGREREGRAGVSRRGENGAL